ncbi:MAG: hypothetical protein ISS57_18640 [Anaerolineales bacterium]|nr:hypothetical protein [Chloroflexota bacterium]MBL7164610.1 hypothetical protein [Anaerolineales bacterium]
MDDKITIIEGPSPTFELIPDIWVHGLVEGSLQAEVVATRLRTFDGGELVDRCQRAWRKQQTIYLEYRTSDGLPDEVPIVAARNHHAEEGEVLLLWVRFPDDSIEIGIDYADDDDFLSDEDDWDLDDF